MSISEPMVMSKGLVEPVRRIEVFTGAGRRRAWTGEEKARIVAESYAGDDTVCGVARRHGLTPQQLFTWRRQARRLSAPAADRMTPMFVPAVVAVTSPAAVPTGARPRAKPTRSPGRGAGLIELEIDGVSVRVGRGADAKTVAAVIRALKAGT